MHSVEEEEEEGEEGLGKEVLTLQRMQQLQLWRYFLTSTWLHRYLFIFPDILVDAKPGLLSNIKEQKTQVVLVNKNHNTRCRSGHLTSPYSIFACTRLRDGETQGVGVGQKNVQEGVGQGNAQNMALRDMTSCMYMTFSNRSSYYWGGAHLLTRVKWFWLPPWRRVNPSCP